MSNVNVATPEVSLPDRKIIANRLFEFLYLKERQVQIQDVYKAMANVFQLTTAQQALTQKSGASLFENEVRSAHTELKKKEYASTTAKRGYWSISERGKKVYLHSRLKKFNQ
ncbi:winged helix-turn-helix domain-containing protein [Viridibacillus sp. YIM B01967]|uniref:Winged helix-turn-helix domain-containing protein n=1 Tax=Viridibacillus soli TaxID=2798301 RepID=A0ABS1H8Y2_9BACL|nr:winged helix-turn-helix domain-containing protein [Viridibacillus soli]MBK3495874.1 winged helix-turn-helix domain-containing protein [Viridibacillus soli]